MCRSSVCSFASSSSPYCRWQRCAILQGIGGRFLPGISCGKLPHGISRPAGVMADIAWGMAGGCCLRKFHFMLYYLFPAVQPRWLVTVAERVEGAAAEESSCIAAKAESETAGQKEAEPAGGDATMETDGAENEKSPVLEGEEDLKMLPVPVRVGEAVDVVAQVGRQPKTITGFQTHTSPVLLNFSERAELATDECKSACRNVSACLHGLFALV